MEHILEQTGPWHYPILIINAFGGFGYPWRIMSNQFTSPKNLDYWCARPNSSISVDEWRAMNSGVDLKCNVLDVVQNVSVPCNAWEYDHSYHRRTLIEEWDAVCGREWQPDTSQSIMMLGMLGSVLVSMVSDWYGRRRCILIAHTLSLITGLAAAFTTSFWAYSLFRFLTSAVVASTYTLAIESVGAQKRAMVAMSGEFGWFIGLIMYPVITYNIRDWRYLQVLSALPDVLFVVWVWFLDESPRWLVSMKRYDEAAVILKKIVDKNGLQKIDVDAAIEEARKKFEAEEKNRADRTRGSIIDLFRGFKIARLTVACLINYCTVVFIYYHLMYYTVEIGTNPYFNLIFMALSEAPISLVSYFVVKYCRRNPVYPITYMAIIVSLCALVFPPESATGIRMTLTSIAKLSGQVTWSVLYVQISECYPTHVRSLISGVVHTGSRISAVVAPLLQTLGKMTYDWVPIAINVSLCALGLSFSFVFPETHGRVLPDTFEECKILLRGKGRKIEDETTEGAEKVEL
ncbi:organic cation transporter protein [Galendromus occidentalis]|uniref:Organic cation transporter protein n=1 Tax=Galendromus occidentalis TaxID=34638 RepID=A0AAJ6QMJ4_9ACAR|nr:organic cation transporter protein [Galendromus occidentalis]